MKKLILLMLLVSCGTKDDPVPNQGSLAVVHTLEITEITSTSAKSGASISSNGGSGIVTSGICWAKKTPVFTDNKSDGEITGLEPLQTYFVRAYAVNGVGTSYGEERTFIANCPSGLGGAVTYSTVVTGTSGTPCGTVTGQCFFNPLGNGLYEIEDASFGVYDCAWNDDPATGIKLTHICKDLVLSGSDQYGLEYSWAVVSNNGIQLVINWANDFGDSGTSTLTRDGGWPLMIQP